MCDRHAGNGLHSNVTQRIARVRRIIRVRARSLKIRMVRRRSAEGPHAILSAARHTGRECIRSFRSACLARTIVEYRPNCMKNVFQFVYPIHSLIAIDFVFVTIFDRKPIDFSFRSFLSILELFNFVACSGIPSLERERRKVDSSPSSAWSSAVARRQAALVPHALFGQTV